MNLLHSMFQDSIDGSVSSKRVVTFLAFLLCATAFLAELFYSYKVSPTTFDAMMYVVVAGLGFTTSEKFSKKVKP